MCSWYCTPAQITLQATVIPSGVPRDFSPTRSVGAGRSSRDLLLMFSVLCLHAFRLRRSQP
jgi:hypothetical protein